MSLKKIVLIYVYYILCALDFEYQDVFLALLFLVKIIINLI